MTAAPARPLDRASLELPRAPIRIVHLGVGSFFRAHLAWYTAQAADAYAWGIAGFSGRGAGVIQALQRQDGLYTLITRDAAGDGVEVVASLSALHQGDDVVQLVEYAARPEVAIISITVTESGYRLTPAGDPDPKDGELARDLHLLAPPPAGSAAPTTTLGRLLLALNARRLAEAGPIAIVPCDNVPHNGAWLRRGLLTAAARVDPELQEWISQHVSCVTSSVDRITPRATPEAGEVAAAAGWIDQAPVVTEPFRDWTMSGQFPAGRPDWESAGARIVEDVAPYERRKLWLLNGAHTIIAAAGLNRGADTVSAAIADAEVWQQVQALWAEAAGHLPPDVEHRDYRERLHQRFANPRIGHLLAQIATDGSTKVQHRLVPITHAELGAGKAALACATGMAEWIVSVMNAVELHDSQATLLQAAREADDPIAALLTVLDQGLAADGSFAAAVRAHVERIAPLLERQAC